MGNSLQPNRDREITHSTAQDDQELARQETEFTCEICIEPASATRKFKNNNLCTHPFCVDCVSKYLEVKILDNTAKIACPGLNCQHNLDPVSCRSLISEPLFSKWCDILCEDSVLDLDKSYCPNRECMTMVVNECTGANVKKSKCPNCKGLFCFQCRKEWHAGFKCEESELMMNDRNDVLFGKLIETNKWQRCPACGHCVELRKGCKFIKCRCKTQFCYSCGKKYSDHKNDVCSTLRPLTPPHRRMGVWEILFFVMIVLIVSVLEVLVIVYGPKLRNR